MKQHAGWSQTHTHTHKEKKKRKSLVHANTHNRSYILTYKLFTAPFGTVYSDAHAAWRISRQSRDPSKVDLMRSFSGEKSERREARGGIILSNKNTGGTLRDEEKGKQAEPDCHAGGVMINVMLCHQLFIPDR